MDRAVLVTSAGRTDDPSAVSIWTLAVSMAAQGGAVSILCAAEVDEAALHTWRGLASGCAVFALTDLPGKEVPVVGMRPHQLHAWRIMFALRRLPADLIVFQDEGGDAFWTTRAKRLGTDFQNTTLAVLVEGPTQWRKQQDATFGARVIDEADLIWCEKQTLGAADLLWSADPAFGPWLNAHDYGCPIVSEIPSGPPPAKPADRAAATNRAAEPPPISVCIAFYRHDRYTDRLVRAFLDMDVPQLQLVIVDDGTPEGERQRLDALQAELRARGHVVERQANAGPGSARNAAAHHAAHDHLLFFDMDNLPFPGLVRELWRGMECAQADSVGAGFAVVPPTEHAPTEADVIKWHLPPGGSLIAGLFDNQLGDTVALIRREAFEAVGGFSTDVPRRGCEDWRLFLRLAAQGYRHLTHPWPLFYYVEHPHRFNRASEAHRYAVRTGLFSEIAQMERSRLVETAQILAAHAQTLRAG